MKISFIAKIMLLIATMINIFFPNQIAIRIECVVLVSFTAYVALMDC